jgi:VWFA-related protein
MTWSRKTSSKVHSCLHCGTVDELTFKFLALLLLLLGVHPAVFSQDTQASAKHPEAQIDLSAIGFHGLSASARLAAQANVSLDFVDDDHVLLTFNPKKMFTRLPDCPPTHDDRLIHAVVLSVPEGKVVREADWYLHDHERYLWALGSGQFLLRRLNTLYVVDSELHEKVLMMSPDPLVWIGVTADGKEIITERKVADTAEKSKAQSRAAKPKVRLDFLDVNTMAVQRTIKSEGKVQIDALSTGFADVIHSRIGKIWLVRFGPTAAKRENITRVRSQCLPDILFSSANTLMVGRCAMQNSDYSVSSFTLTGHFLWRQHWKEHRYTPRLKRSDDGSRVAVSSIVRVMVDAQAQTEVGADDTDRGLKQNIEVIDTASGNSVLSLEVMPAVMSAQNVSLSPGGRRLALLQGSVLGLYQLLDLSQEDRAKYLAVKEDVPGLYTTSSASDPDSEEDTFTSVDASETAATPEEHSTADHAANDSAPAREASARKAESPSSVVTSASSSDVGPIPEVTIKATSRIVVEDIVVTDSKGHPVKGLRQQDFQLIEDGKPQRIRAFEEYPAEGAVLPATAPATAGKTTGQLSPNIFTNNRATGQETGSSTIIVLDLLNTAMPDQVRAKEYLINFVKKRPAASQMAICSLSSNLRLIQGFTRDENVLLAAVKGKKGGVKAPPWQSDSGLQKSVQLARDAALLTGTEASVLALQRAQNAVDEQNAHDIDVRMRFTLDAFMQLSRYLAGIPGRKNMIWLSGSFPMSIQPNPEVRGYDPVTRNYESDIKRVTNLLADAHVAVYPVSATGLVARNDVSSANYYASSLPGAQGPPSIGVPSALANVASSLPLSSSIDTDNRNFRETEVGQITTMDEVANLTGGKAFYNTNAIDVAIDSAVDIGSHYYTLSYTPTNNKYDGAFRKIKVALEKQGYHLAYRGGYYAQDPDAGLKDTRKPQQRIGVAAMQQGAPQSRQVVFTARVVPIGKPRKVEAAQAEMAGKAKKKGAQVGPVEMQHYGIDYAVDATDLRFGQTPEGLYHSVVDFMVTAFNDDGRLVASVVSTTTNDLKSASYKDVMTGGYRLHQELDVPTEAVSLRMGIEDVASSRVGTLEIALPVPVPPDELKVATRTLPPIEPD